MICLKPFLFVFTGWSTADLRVKHNLRVESVKNTSCSIMFEDGPELIIPKTLTLQEVVRLKDLESAKILIKKGTNVNKKDSRGKFSLEIAIAKNTYHEAKEVIKLLMEHGALISLKDNDGNTPVELALKMGTLHSLKQMLHLDFTRENP